MSFDPFADPGAEAAPSTPKSSSSPMFRNSVLLVLVLVVLGRIFLSVHTDFEGFALFRSPPHFWARILCLAAIFLGVTAFAYLGKTLMGLVGAVGYAVVASVLLTTFTCGLSVSQKIGSEWAIAIPLTVNATGALVVGGYVGGARFCRGMLLLFLVCLTGAAASWIVSWFVFGLPKPYWAPCSVLFIASWLGSSLLVQRLRRRLQEDFAWAPQSIDVGGKNHYRRYFAVSCLTLGMAAAAWAGFVAEQYDRFLRFQLDDHPSGWGYADWDGRPAKRAPVNGMAMLTYLRGGWCVSNLWLHEGCDTSRALRCALPLLEAGSTVEISLSKDSFRNLRVKDLPAAQHLPAALNCTVYNTYKDSPREDSEKLLQLVERYPNLSSLRLLGCRLPSDAVARMKQARDKASPNGSTGGFLTVVVHWRQGPNEPALDFSSLVSVNSSFLVRTQPVSRDYSCVFE